MKRVFGPYKTLGMRLAYACMPSIPFFGLCVALIYTWGVSGIFIWVVPVLFSLIQVYSIARAERYKLCEYIFFDSGDLQISYLDFVSQRTLQATLSHFSIQGRYLRVRPNTFFVEIKIDGKALQIHADRQVCSAHDFQEFITLASQNWEKSKPQTPGSSSVLSYNE